MVPAIAEYDVVFQDGDVKLNKSSDQGRAVSLANNTQSISTNPATLHTWQQDTLDDITVDAALIVNSNASASLEQTNSSIYYAMNASSFNAFATDHMNLSDHFFDMSWLDPTPDIIWTMNALMFRAAVVATRWKNLLPIHGNKTNPVLDPGVTRNQTVAAVQEVTQNIYKSDLRWWAGAAVLQIATACLILPMFWGWWKLECSLTLSPFTTALAFDSPILQDVNSASRPREIVDKIGTMRLKYGVVMEPRTGSFIEDTAYASGRLGLAESGWVVKPTKGIKFHR